MNKIILTITYVRFWRGVGVGGAQIQSTSHAGAGRTIKHDQNMLFETQNTPADGKSIRTGSFFLINTQICCDLIWIDFS